MTASASFAPNLLASRRAVVVGGCTGIGAAIGRTLAAAGAQVKATSVVQAELDRARADPTFNGIETQFLDVRDEASVKDLFAREGRLDILVNCAGLIKRAAEHDPAAFAEVVEVNLIGTMRCCSAARPLLRDSHGAIVNIASMLSFFGAGQAPGYSASKGGVAQLTKSLAIAYAADGIRVNALAPGWIATQFTRVLQEDNSRSDTIVARTPMGRWGAPDDLAGPALFLCSPAAGFVTGVILPVDGGYLIA